MEQKTEASQAVDLPMLPDAAIKGLGVRINRGGPAMDYEYYTADQMQDYARASLKAQPAPTEAAQGDPLDMKLPCDVVIGNMTIRKGVRLGVLVGKAQRLRARVEELLPKPTPEQIAAFNAMLPDHITNVGEMVTAQGEDSARLDAEVKRLRSVIDTALEGWNMSFELRKMLETALWPASAETGGVKP